LLRNIACLRFWKFYLYIRSETEITAVYTEKCDFTTEHRYYRNCYIKMRIKLIVWNHLKGGVSSEFIGSYSTGLSRMDCDARDVPMLHTKADRRYELKRDLG